jgi:hypothetical protein
MSREKEREDGRQRMEYSGQRTEDRRNEGRAGGGRREKGQRRG